MNLTVTAWDAMNLSIRYEGRSLIRAVLEMLAARRSGFRRVLLEVT